jgi:hypothetical protein
VRTVYGYPQPLGDTGDEALSRLADALAEDSNPLHVALSPLGAGGRLAEFLTDRLPVAGVRQLWMVDLERDPLAGFNRAAQAKVRRALRGGAKVEVGPVRPSFVPLYRSAMEDRSAEAIYRFDDQYFGALPAADAFQVSITDPSGLSAAVVFLSRGDQASYHLSARRATPPSVPGAANLALAGGLEECARRGARACLLGGGLTGAVDDPLFMFKASMATSAIARPTFARGRRQ